MHHHHNHTVHKTHTTHGKTGNDKHDSAPEQYNKHHGHHTHDFLQRFVVCLILTIPVLILSPMIQEWAGFTIRFSYNSYVLGLLSTLIYFYGGAPFLKGLYSEIRVNAIGMMTLVAIAITVSYVYSVATLFGLKGMDFFWELATLIDIMLLGHWLEMKSETAASGALESLAKLLPSVVHIETTQGLKDVDISAIKKDDIVVVKPGEKIPADGKVIEGSSNVNESMLTGESRPVPRKAGDHVIAGSINQDGMLRITATATGKESYLEKVITLVKEAQAAKSETQNLADKVARWLTIISVTTGFATFGYWLYSSGDASFAIERMVTVMVTACPHALGVAIPLVAAISTTRAATTGILIRNRTAFESARKISCILFDKTGTLTKGSHEVHHIISLSDNYSKEQILQYAAAVQQHSEHYIGRGIMNKLKTSGLELWKSTAFQYTQGIGVSANVESKNVKSVGPNYFVEKNAPLPEIPSMIDLNRETVIYILIDGTPEGILTLADSVRETSSKAIADLKEKGIKSYLITGDNEHIAKAVANTLKMDGYFANVLPHQKQEKIRDFQNRGEVVAMTGDGVNDAPALAAANIGIAVGSGTDVAAETADIILVHSDPQDIVNMISSGRRTYNKMVQNLFWAAGYNIVAIPLAAGVLYPEFLLSPALGAVLMSGSTIIVAANAQLLRF